MSTNKFAEKFQGKTSKIGKDGLKSMFGIAEMGTPSHARSSFTPISQKPYHGKRFCLKRQSWHWSYRATKAKCDLWATIWRRSSRILNLKANTRTIQDYSTAPYTRATVSTNTSPIMGGLRKPSRQLASSLDNPNAFLPLLTRPRAAIDLGPKLLQAPHYLQKITGHLPRKSDADKNGRSLIQVSRSIDPKSQLGISIHDHRNQHSLIHQQGGSPNSGGHHLRGLGEVADHFQPAMIQIRRNPSKSAGTLGVGTKRFQDSYPHSQATGLSKPKPYRSPFAAGAEHELRNSVQQPVIEPRYQPVRTNPGFIKSFTQTPSNRNPVKPVPVSSAQVGWNSAQVNSKTRKGHERATNPLDKQIQELQQDLQDLDGQYEFYANRVPRRTTDF